MSPVYALHEDMYCYDCCGKGCGNTERKERIRRRQPQKGCENKEGKERIRRWQPQKGCGKKGKEQIRERQSQKGCGNDKVIYRIFMHRLFVPSGLVREDCAAKSENIVDTIFFTPDVCAPGRCKHPVITSEKPVSGFLPALPLPGAKSGGRMNGVFIRRRCEHDQTGNGAEIH